MRNLPLERFVQCYIGFCATLLLLLYLPLVGWHPVETLTLWERMKFYTHTEWNHSREEAVLELSSWEQASVVGIQNVVTTWEEGMRSCRPPGGVSQRCCLGTFSMGGDVVVEARFQCGGRTLEDYDVVRQHAQQVLSRSDHLLLDNNKNHYRNNKTTAIIEYCDVCRIVDLALQHNLTIGFLGDSMMNQVVQGFLCELSRRHYRVTTRVEFRHETCRRCIKWISHVTIQDYEKQQQVSLKFMLQYRYPFEHASEQDYVASSFDVLIFNFGLHWGYEAKRYDAGRHHYRKSYGELLNYLRNHGTAKMLVHRETSAQHFDADGGDWGLRQSGYNKLCVPIRPNATTAGWREEMVRQVAVEQGFEVLVANHNLPPKRLQSWQEQKRELYILPFFDFTAVHFDMHPLTQTQTGLPKGECTHFCSSPHLYLPLWRSLRLAMDREFG